MTQARRSDRAGRRRWKRRSSGPIAVAAALAAGLAACTLLAPSDDDLFDAGPPKGGSGGRPSGTAGTNGLDGGQGGDPTSSAGRGMDDAGAGGTAGAAGAAGDTSGAGAFSEGGSAGNGGTAPVCTPECRALDEECTATTAGPACTCVAGLVRDGTACRVPRSCNELHRAAPELPSGSYALQPAGAAKSFSAHCGMALEGGGWTLVVSEGPTFDPATMGVPDVCYSSNCTNVGYAQVLLESDVMIDMSNSPILNATYTARVVITGVHAMSRGKTLRTLFTTGPNFVEAEDDSNVAVRMMDGAECSTLPRDMARVVCDDCGTMDCMSAVMVFGDGDSAAGCRTTPAPLFAIGAASDYATPWSNCAGWPQDPNSNGGDFYPDYVRVWVR